MQLGGRRLLGIAVIVLVVVGAFYTGRVFLDHDSGLSGGPVEAREPGQPDWQPPQPKPAARRVSDEERDELLRRSQVWRPPPVPIEQVSFADATIEPRVLPCRFRVTELGGTTPKFDCNLESGELVRIKYGKTGEVPGEIAATRLLRAMGFGADDVRYVETLHCYGCPEEPFSVMKTVQITQTEPLYRNLLLDHDDYEGFDWVAIERKFDAAEVRTERIEGWGMFELDRIDPREGAPRAHVDALRLLAVFLAHWDNKPENQRLVCLSQGDGDARETCEQPFLLLQDLGSTFGPTKVDLEAWEQSSIWDDRASCVTSMRELPFNGATFGQARISEDGRRFLGDMLTRFSDQQITDLFTSARFDDALGLFRRSTRIAEWVRVFKARVRQIAEGPRCPL